MIGVSQLLLIFVIVLVLFGAGKIPTVMKDLGSGLRAFKKGIEGGEEEIDLINNTKNNEVKHAKKSKNKKVTNNKKKVSKNKQLKKKINKKTKKNSNKNIKKKKNSKGSKKSKKNK